MVYLGRQTKSFKYLKETETPNKYILGNYGFAYCSLTHLCSFQSHLAASFLKLTNTYPWDCFPFVTTYNPFSQSPTSLSRLNLKIDHFKDTLGDENPSIYNFQLS